MYYRITTTRPIIAVEREEIVVDSNDPRIQKIVQSPEWAAAAAGGAESLRQVRRMLLAAGLDEEWVDRDYLDEVPEGDAYYEERTVSIDTLA